LPDYPAKTGDRVTLHELLSHTSGIPSYTDDEAFMNGRDKDHTPAQVLATFEDKPLHFEPGSDWEYSNSNYFLLGLVIEKVSGKTYERYLQDHVLAAAGMTRTSTVDAPDAPDTAIGYDADDSGDETPSRARAISMTVPFAAGALRSTVNDLVKWDRALAGRAVLSEASKARMFTPVRNDYGYGVGVDTVEGHVVESHGGDIDGFRSYFVRIPDAGLAVVVLCNSPVDPEPIGRALPPMLLAGKRTPPVKERELTEVTPHLVARALGDYTMSVASKKDLEGKLPKTLVEDIARIQVSADGTKLFARPNGQPRMRVFWGGGDLLFTKRGGVEIVLEGEANQPAKSLVLTQGALTVRYERGM
jgi:CubicO group peptidase (beta-lactamase class C family)